MLNIKPQMILSEKYPIRVLCDSNHFGFSAAIQSKVNGKWLTCTHYSKRFPTATVRACSSINKELLGLLLALHKWRRFILVRDDVEVLLDCKSLVHLIAKAANPGENSKPSRWLSKLSEYNLKFVHHTGRENLRMQDCLANRFKPDDENEPHIHLAQYCFNKCQREQVKLKLEEGKTYTENQIRTMVEQNPGCIEPPDPKHSSMVGDKTISCEKCSNYQVQEDKTKDDGLERKSHAEIVQMFAESAQNSRPSSMTNTLNPSTNCDEVETIEKIDFDPKYTKHFTNFNIDEVRKAQASNKDCQDIIRHLWSTKGKVKTPERMKRFKMIGDLLCRSKNKRKPAEIGNLQIYVPRPLITQFIASVHAIGHPSDRKMRKQITRYFYHPEMRRLTKTIAQGCKICLDYKNYGPNNQMPEGMLRPPRYPRDILYIDLFYMRPARFRGKRYIGVLNIVCGFSAYTWAQLLTAQDTDYLLTIFESIVPHIGPVSEIRSDGASNLCVNEKVATYVKELGISPQVTIAYNSKSNGLCEVMNKLLRQQILFFCETFKGSWPSHFHRAKQALNLIPHKSEKLSELTPYELVFGVKPTSNNPLGFLDSLNPEVAKIIHQTHQKAIKEFQHQRYDKMQQLAEERYEMSRLKPGAYVKMIDIDRKSKEKPFLVYDRVYKITDRLQHLVHLENVKDPNERIRTHINNIRLIHERPTSIFDEITPSQKQIIGRPLTQRQLKRLLKRGLLHPDFDPNVKSNILKECNNSSTNSSTIITWQRSPPENKREIKDQENMNLPTEMDDKLERARQWVIQQELQQNKRNPQGEDKNDVTSNKSQNTEENSLDNEIQHRNMADESVLQDLDKTTTKEIKRSSRFSLRKLQRVQQGLLSTHNLLQNALKIRKRGSQRVNSQTDMQKTVGSSGTQGQLQIEPSVTKSNTTPETTQPEDLNQGPGSSNHSSMSQSSSKTITSSSSETTTPQQGRRLRPKPRLDFLQLHRTGKKVYK